MIFSGQGVPQDTSANNYVWVGANFRIYAAKMDSLRIKYHNVKTWFPDTMNLMRSNVNTKLAKSDTTGKWKPIGWNPPWTSISGKPVFSNVATSGSYSDLSGTPNLSLYYLASNPNGYISSVPAQSFASLTGKPTTLSGYGITDAYPLNNPNNYISRSGISAGTGISYNNGSGVVTNSAPDQVVSLTSGTGISVTGTYPNFTVSGSSTAATFNNSPSRPVNSTSWQVSTTRPARVSYTVSCTTALALLNLNSNAQVFLEISSNNSTWITVNGAGSTKTLSVSITVGINDTTLYNLQCEVPSGWYVRLRSVTSGGGTTAFSSGQEITY